MKKYVLVGCGSRGIYAYAIPLVRDFAEEAELCGVYDINVKRAKLVSEMCGKKIPVYESFSQMIETVKPDTVIVASKDCTHDQYVIQALYASCDVIVEKPLTTTFEKALAIQKAEEETGKKVTVVFNLRFHPFFKQIKEIVASGAIGVVYSVNYEWMLDTDHGGDYFRRWHRQRENSGSLMVHKSTHHFDIANWLLEQEPLEVNAYGARHYYGPVRENRSERCLNCPHNETCEFYKDIHKNESWKTLYFNCEDADGYFIDRCVFSEQINIEDTVNLTVRYSGGTLMNYMLTAHSPYEGFRLVLNGSLGRLEVKKITGKKPNFDAEKDNYIKLYNRNEEEIFVPVRPDTAGGHGGADDGLREALFKGMPEDPLCQMADTRAGRMSIGIGMAANISMAENRKVYLDEFYKELENKR